MLNLRCCHDPILLVERMNTKIKFRVINIKIDPAKIPASRHKLHSPAHPAHTCINGKVYVSYFGYWDRQYHWRVIEDLGPLSTMPRSEVQCPYTAKVAVSSLGVQWLNPVHGLCLLLVTTCMLVALMSLQCPYCGAHWHEIVSLSISISAIIVLRISCSAIRACKLFTLHRMTDV